MTRIQFVKKQIMLYKRTKTKQMALRYAWENRRTLFGEFDPAANFMSFVCGISQRMVENYYNQLRKNKVVFTDKRICKDGHIYTISQPQGAAAV